MGSLSAILDPFSSSGISRVDMKEAVFLNRTGPFCGLFSWSLVVWSWKERSCLKIFHKLNFRNKGILLLDSILLYFQIHKRLQSKRKTYLQNIKHKRINLFWHRFVIRQSKGMFYNNKPKINIPGYFVMMVLSISTYTY